MTSGAGRRGGAWPVRAYFALLFALCLIGALGFAVVVSAQLDRDARRSAEANAAFAATAAAKELGDHVALLRASVAQLATNPQIAQVFDNPAGCSLAFAGIGGPDRGHIDIIRADGTVACSSRKATAGKTVSYADSAWFAKALTGSVLVAPQKDVATGAPVAVAAMPVRGGGGLVAGFADLGAFGPYLESHYSGGRAMEFLLTTDGGRTVVARSIAPERWISTSLAGTRFAAEAGEVERRDLDGTPRLYGESRVPGTGWKLFAGEDRGAALASLDRLKRRQLQMIVVGLAAVLLAGWLVYRRVVAPMRRLSSGVALKAANGGLTADVPLAGPAEVRRLANDVNALIASVNHELAERRRAEAAAQLSEENYRMLFESNPSPMWVFDVETLRFLAVNNAAVESYGYTRSEFLSMTIEDIRDSSDIPRLRAALPLQDEFSRTGIWQHRRKDGSLLDAEVSVHRHEFDGHAARVVVAVDVTERVRAEQALRESEARYRDLFENATDLIATTDLEGRLTGANHAFVTTLGYEPDELLGRPLLGLVPPEWHESLAHAASVKLEAGGATVYEHELVAQDGTRVQVEVASRLIEEDGRPVGVEAICRNISERKLLEDQLRQAQRLEAIGRLAGGVAHDFNNLLTVIGGYTEALLRSADGSTRELEEIASAAQRAANLTRQLLAFSRQQVLQPRVLAINGIVEGIVPMLTRLIGEDVELSTALDPETAPVLADPSQLEQVLVNLVVNARDAMPEGGRLVIQTANVELDDHYAAEHPEATPGAHAVLTVSDTGVGMDGETASHIFEPFFTTKPVGSGTGLGLATVYGIVKQSGGTIWVYSEPGQGTTFKVFLPAAEAAPSAHEERGPGTAPTGSETILVAEDEEVLRDLTMEMLRERGYTVIAAETPQHALDLVAEEHEEIDLLLTDLVMPHMGGIELADRLRVANPHLRVLFMSGYAGEAVTRNGGLELAAGLIEKPFSSIELARRVRDVLDGRGDADPQLAA